MIEITNNMTVIEWIENKIGKEHIGDFLKNILTGAKELERQKRIEAFDDGFQQGVQSMVCANQDKDWDGVDDGEDYVKVQDWSEMRTRNIK